MNIKDFIESVLKVKERATPTPWKWFGKYYKYLVGPKYTDVILQEIGLPNEGMLSPEKENAEFIVFSVNNIDKLARSVLVMHKALQWYGERENFNKDNRIAKEAIVKVEKILE